MRPVTAFLAGTFDGVHAGHIKLLEFARKKAQGLAKRLKNPDTKLHVIVARDSSVKRVKGKSPVQNELERLAVVKNLKGVDEATLGHPVDFFESVRKVKPDVIVLGHDQGDDKIIAHLNHMGYKIVVRCPPFNRRRLRSRNLKSKHFQHKI